MPQRTIRILPISDIHMERRKLKEIPALDQSFDVLACAGDLYEGQPEMAIQGMVTRTGWDGKTWGANQRITIEEALRVNTLNGAYNSHEEAIKGSISPGKLADFVVLSADLFTVDTAKIKDLEIVRTERPSQTVMRQADRHQQMQNRIVMRADCAIDKQTRQHAASDLDIFRVEIIRRRRAGANDRRQPIVPVAYVRLVRRRVPVGQTWIVHQ